MNSAYGDDLFENGWAASTPEQPQAYTSIPSSSIHSTVGNNIASRVPPQYKNLYEHLNGRAQNVTELEAAVFAPLIAHQYLTQYQSSRLIDVMYDHNILPPNVENNFYQIIGLLALELEVSGSGDYVTLQFRLNSGLPELSEQQYQLLLLEESKSNSVGPLAALLGNVVLEEPVNPPNSQWPEATIDNPLMADTLALSIDPDLSVSDLPHTNDEAYVKKYVTDLRDGFLPLVGQNDLIKIKEVPEKEGLLFKHINYTISHELNLGTELPAGPRKVIRRYSDFVWLLEFLLKKYPLRVIPGLPPKKFAGMLYSFYHQKNPFMFAKHSISSSQLFHSFSHLSPFLILLTNK